VGLANHHPFVTFSLSFVALYSFLPHKEWRFIIYVIPGLTSVAAVSASWIWQQRSKSFVYRLLNLLLISSVVASFVASAGLSAISRLNYPGGEAIVRLRDIAKADQRPLHVYADNLACQTGVTRFLEARNEKVFGDQKWVFDKTEDKERLLDPVFWDQFDYALVESVERSIGKWEVLDVVNGFGGIKVVRPGQDLGHEVSLEKSSTLRAWHTFESVMREKVTKGWWLASPTVPKLRIVKRQSTPPNSAVAPEADITQEVI